jgi:hypothetical protein
MGGYLADVAEFTYSLFECLFLTAAVGHQVINVIPQVQFHFTD